MALPKHSLFHLLLLFLIAALHCSAAQYSPKTAADVSGSIVHRHARVRKMAKLRSHLLEAGSLGKFEKRLNGYCAARQRGELSQFMQSANASANGCDCDGGGSCACCASMNVDFRFVHIHKEVCLNLTYLHESKSIRIIVSIDKRAVFNFTVSATNPPPACLPFLVGELCIEFYDLKLEERQFSGCSLLELVLLHQEVVHEKMGCWRLPVPVRALSSSADASLEQEANVEGQQLD